MMQEAIVIPSLRWPVRSGDGISVIPKGGPDLWDPLIKFARRGRKLVDPILDPPSCQSPYLNLELLPRRRLSIESKF